MTGCSTVGLYLAVCCIHAHAWQARAAVGPQPNPPVHLTRHSRRGPGRQKASHTLSAWAQPAGAPVIADTPTARMFW